MEAHKVDSDVSLTSSLYNFGFAFNDSNFSDRTLRIEILDETSVGEDPSELELCEYSDTEEERRRKRPRTKKDDPSELELKGKEEVGQEHEGTPRPCVSFKTLHINSAVLAAKSPFFYKLFTNGMKESSNRYVTLRINASEEHTLMELLRFIYAKPLSAATIPALLDILMAADKYEVDSCVKHCSRILRGMVNKPASAFMLLELTANISTPAPVQPLVDVAKKLFVARYRDINKFQDEMLKLPLSVIKAIFSSDDLQAQSEDAVYDFILKWARKHYKNAKERLEVLQKHLHELIRFPFVSFQKLQEVLQCSDFGHELASKCVSVALSYKAASPYEQCSLAATKHEPQFVERAYISHPIKVVGYVRSHQHCVVYLVLKREECAKLKECAKLNPVSRIKSQPFPLGTHMFVLMPTADMYKQRQSFGLTLEMHGNYSVGCSVECKFAARSKPTENYVDKLKSSATPVTSKGLWYRDILRSTWSSFMADESPYFIDDRFYIRAELSIKN